MGQINMSLPPLQWVNGGSPYIRQEGSHLEVVVADVPGQIDVAIAIRKWFQRLQAECSDYFASMSQALESESLDGTG
jgi:hypothetical protein